MTPAILGADLGAWRALTIVSMVLTARGDAVDSAHVSAYFARAWGES